VQNTKTTLEKIQMDFALQKLSKNDAKFSDTET